MTEQQPEQQVLPPVKVALILDGEVADILHTDERLGAIFLSNPLIVDVTNNLFENGGTAMVGGTFNYDTEEFGPRVDV